MGFELVTPPYITVNKTDPALAIEQRELNRFLFRLATEAATLKLGFRETLSDDRILRDCIDRVKAEFPDVHCVKEADSSRPDLTRFHFFVSKQAEIADEAILYDIYTDKSIRGTAVTATMLPDKYGAGRVNEVKGPCPCCNQVTEPEILEKFLAGKQAVFGGLSIRTRAHNVIPHSAFSKGFFTDIFAKLLEEEGKPVAFNADDLYLLHELDEVIGIASTGTGASGGAGRQCPLCELLQKDDSLIARYALIKQSLQKAAEGNALTEWTISSGKKTKSTVEYKRPLSAMVGEQWGATAANPTGDINEILRHVVNYASARIAGEANRLLSETLNQEVSRIFNEIIIEKQSVTHLQNPSVTLKEITDRLSPVLQVYLTQSEKFIWATRRHTVNVCREEAKLSLADVANITHTAINPKAADRTVARFEGKETLPMPQKLTGEQLRLFAHPKSRAPLAASNEPVIHQASLRKTSQE